MKRRVALVLHWSFFRLLSRIFPGIAGILRHPDTEHFREGYPDTLAQDSYFKRYLFGNDEYHGIINDYLNRGWLVDIVEETRFKSSITEFSSVYERYDFQFSSNIPIELIDTLLNIDCEIVGWGPPQLGSKKTQALWLSQNNTVSKILPKQLIISKKSELHNIDLQSVIAEFPSDYLIAKAFYSNNASMPDGSGSRIFKKQNWQQFIDLATEKDSWFSIRDGLIISELIETRDPYLDNNNAVVHKVHLASGFKQNKKNTWRPLCKKLSAQLDLSLIGDSIMEINSLFRFKSWTYSNLDDYRNELDVISSEFFTHPCLFSADFMIKPNGKLYFLEINKIAGTFMDHIKAVTNMPLVNYMHRLDSFTPENRLTKDMIKNYKHKLRLASQTSSESIWMI